MLYTEFCVKCIWNFRGFLKLHTAFHNRILNFNNEYNTQKNWITTRFKINIVAKKNVQFSKGTG